MTEHDTSAGTPEPRPSAEDLIEVARDMKPRTISFDVYGTLVDPLGMTASLQTLVGNHADRVAALWREKQIEYTFRRGLMHRYEDFNVCTRQALLYVTLSLGIALSDQDRERLLEAYQHLEPFPDIIPTLQALKNQGHTLVAFSNGVEATVRTLLESADIQPYLDDIVSVDGLRTFKPDPDVYRYLTHRVGAQPRDTWLVSSNAWDVIGAKAAGLSAVWLKRRSDAIYDPWDIEPDMVSRDLHELAANLEDG